MSPQQIKDMAHVKITSSEGIQSGEKKEGSMYDPKLGVITKGIRCQTCELNADEDAGHFGYIEFAEPIINTNFITSIKKILKCVCFKCGYFLIPKNRYLNVLSLKKNLRLDKCENIAGLASVKCENTLCTGHKNPDFDKYSGYGIHIIEKSGIDKNHIAHVRPKYIKWLFSHLTDQQIRVLGFSPKFSRPEWMIFVYYPVAPPSLRPVMQTSDNKKSEDDMFRMLATVVKENNKILKMIGEFKMLKDKDSKLPDTIEQHHASMSIMVSNIMNTNAEKGYKVGYAHIPGHSIKSITERLKGKKGLLRGNIMGKRMTHTARSVIIPDNDIQQDEIGVPKYIAKALLYPEAVNNINKEYMRQYIINGHNKYPGAEYVYTISHDKFGEKISGHKSRIKLSIFDREMRKIIADDLEVGDIVERMLISGDVVLVNRQPSLHRYSVMGFTAKVYEGDENSLGLFITNTTPLNAD